ncbi:MAG: hypothetical protein B6U73_00545 [Desulfurococcales archaeon ex4484_204]|nr:MAG: hypothetical protein B6U73_00545 [Desulfurococcales archaeon ex4484_204]
MNPIKVVFLGSRGPTAGDDDMPGVLISYGKHLVLIDASEGIQKRIAIAGYSIVKVSKILITHLHGDHILGLIPLLQSMSLSGVKEDVDVVGPPGISSYLDANFNKLFFKPSFNLHVKEVLNECFKLAHGMTAYAFPLDHGIPTVAFNININGKSIAYVSDTKPSYDYMHYLESPDLLIHDAAFSSELRSLAIKYGHSTARDAAEIAAKSNAKLLILYHISPRYRNVDTLLNEARAIFRNTYVAEKFLKVLIK